MRGGGMDTQGGERWTEVVGGPTSSWYLRGTGEEVRGALQGARLKAAAPRSPLLSSTRRCTRKARGAPALAPPPRFWGRGPRRAPPAPPPPRWCPS